VAPPILRTIFSSWSSSASDNFVRSGFTRIELFWSPAGGIAASFGRSYGIIWRKVSCLGISDMCYPPQVRHDTDADGLPPVRFPVGGSRLATYSQTPAPAIRYGLPPPSPVGIGAGGRPA
jgi:hypothetical protein